MQRHENEGNKGVKRGSNCLYFKQELWISLPEQFAIDPASSSLLLSRQEKALQTLKARSKTTISHN